MLDLFPENINKIDKRLRYIIYFGLFSLSVVLIIFILSLFGCKAKERVTVVPQIIKLKPDSVIYKLQSNLMTPFEVFSILKENNPSVHDSVIRQSIAQWKVTDSTSNLISIPTVQKIVYRCDSTELKAKYFELNLDRVKLKDESDKFEALKSEFYKANDKEQKRHFILMICSYIIQALVMLGFLVGLNKIKRFLNKLKFW